MAECVIGLVLSLAAIVAAAELFTNGIEWLGKRWNLASGVVGSVLAAVGTALPETMVGIVAVIVGTKSSHQIGIGAILGAPFLLSTLAFAVTGIAALAYRKRRRTGARLVVDRQIMSRDLSTFIVLYVFAIAASFVPFRLGRLAICAILTGGYALYLIRTFRGTGKIEGELNPLHLKVVFFRWFTRRDAEEAHEDFLDRRRQRQESAPSIRPIIVQLFVALAIIVGGARYFVDAAGIVSQALGVAPMIFAMVVAPIITELPEKANSVTWIRQSKDTLSLGNITGAMVFQSTLIPAIGIAFTEWELLAGAHKPQAALFSAAVAIFSGAMVLRAVGRAEPHDERHHWLSPFLLIGMGMLYFVWAVAVFVIRW
jgi:cation:H+ antiporter